jgi:hypothetical protein
MRFLLVALLFICPTSVCLAGALSPPVFNITVVGPPAGHSQVTGSKTNNNQDFLGLARTPTGYDPVLWLSDRGYTSIGLPSGDKLIELNGINDQRQVIGISTSGAFVWSEAVGYVPMVAAQGFRDPHPTAINRRGQVVGYVFPAASRGDLPNLRRGFSWNVESRRMTVPRSNQPITPVSVNTRGDIVGTAERKDGSTTAAYATGFGSAMPLTRDFQDSEAVDVNDYGAVALNMLSVGGQAYLWTRNGKGDGLVPIPVGGTASALAIDNKKQILGLASGLSFNGSFLWSPSYGWADVQTLLAPGSPDMPDLFVEGMSERTFMVGSATVDGVLSAVILRPIEP